MILKTFFFFNFVKNNPNHFKGLNSEIDEFFNRPPMCVPCSKMAGQTSATDQELDIFKKLLSNPSNYKAIIDKSKELLYDDIQLQDFSVNT